MINILLALTMTAALTATSALAQSTIGTTGQTGAVNRPGMASTSLTPEVMGVSIELIRDAEVVGAEGEEIGDVVNLVRYPDAGGVGTVSGTTGTTGVVGTTGTTVTTPTTGVAGTTGTMGTTGTQLGQGQGIYAVVNIDNGWFAEDTQFVVPISRFTLVEDGRLMLSGVTADMFETEYDRYDEANWVRLDENYRTVGDAYRGYGWGN